MELNETANCSELVATFDSNRLREVPRCDTPGALAELFQRHHELSNLNPHSAGPHERAITTTRINREENFQEFQHCVLRIHSTRPSMDLSKKSDRNNISQDPEMHESSPSRHSNKDGAAVCSLLAHCSPQFFGKG